MKKAELVFIPAPGMGHLVAMVEAAKLLIDVNNSEKLSITVLIIKSAYDSKVPDYVQSLNANPSFSNRIRLIDLPQPHEDLTKNLSPAQLFTTYIQNHKPQAKEAITTIINNSDGLVLAGIVLDMFCTSMIDVADELGVPSYMFFTSGAAMLDLMFFLQFRHDEENLDTTKFKDSDGELEFSSFVNPLPGKVLPSSYLDNEWAAILFDMARRFRETKGIMVNSFTELESHTLNSISNTARNIPPVYPVGPILNLKGEDNQRYDSNENDIIKWLDGQPASSVVFLCFGSMGSFSETQAKEIASALEQSGNRFLWSLRKPAPKGKMLSPSDYDNLEDVLPDGFLDRTSGIGKVIGWAPQVRILAHPAIGGFVSHCGWNSTLESLWFGVPIAAWPLYAEQQLNAFQLVVELGLAVEIQMDYRKESEQIVGAEKIRKGIVGVMEGGSDVRKRVKEMSEKSRTASVMGGGSSFSSLCLFITHVMDNIF